MWPTHLPCLRKDERLEELGGGGGPTGRRGDVPTDSSLWVETDWVRARNGSSFDDTLGEADEVEFSPQVSPTACLLLS